MPDEIELAIARTLESIREPLIFKVSESLSVDLPILGDAAVSNYKATLHHYEMSATARRFHEIVQVALTVDWRLVMLEFTWGRRVLSRRGVTHEHLHILIDTYFVAAVSLYAWPPEQYSALCSILRRFRDISLNVYSGPSID